MATLHQSWGLIKLPNEIIFMIIGKLEAPSLNQLSRTCQFLFELVDPFLYSNVSIRDIKRREAFILALSKRPQRRHLVKGMRFDYDLEENPSECFSDLSLANALPNLESFYIRSPYGEPSDTMNEDLMKFHGDIQKGSALSRLRECSIWIENRYGSFVSGKRAELLFRIARQPKLESMTIRNVKVTGRKPQDWSTESLTFPETEADEKHSCSCLTKLRILDFNMDPGSFRWCLWRLDSLKSLEIRLPKDSYSLYRNTYYSPAHWVEDLLPVASTLEFLIVTGPLARSRDADWKSFRRLRSLQVDSDWLYDSTGTPFSIRIRASPSAILPPNLEKLEVIEATGDERFLMFLVTLAMCKGFYRPRLSKLILRHTKEWEFGYLKRACKMMNVEFQNVLVTREWEQRISWP